MDRNKFEKEAFGYSFKGKVISGIEIGIIIAGCIALFFYFFLFKLVLNYSQSDITKIPYFNIFYFSFGWFCVGFIIGCTKSYPFMARFIKPTERSITKYKLKRMREVTTSIENRKKLISESRAELDILQLQLGELIF